MGKRGTINKHFRFVVRKNDFVNFLFREYGIFYKKSAIKEKILKILKSFL